MKREIILLTTLITSNLASACLVPKTGEEYNALVKVVGPNQEGSYSISVQEKLEDYRNSPRVYLDYSTLNENGYSKIVSASEIATISDGSKMNGVFKVEDIKDHRARVKVIWPPNEGGLCGVYAYSKYLRAN